MIWYFKIENRYTLSYV